MPHPDPDQLALAALEEDVDDETARHLQTCSECRAELADLRRVVSAARYEDAPDNLSSPPAHVWERIAQDVGLRDASPAPPHRAGSVTDTGQRSVTSRWQRRSRLFAAAAGFVLGVAGAGIAAYLLADDEPAPRQPTTVATADLQAVTDGRSEGRARVVERNGERALTLSVRPRPGSRGADFREVWLLDAESGRLVSLGMLTSDRASFALPIGLDLQDYPTVDVSDEPFDGDPAHSGDSVARGDLKF